MDTRSHEVIKKGFEQVLLSALKSPPGPWPLASPWRREDSRPWHWKMEIMDFNFNYCLFSFILEHLSSSDLFTIHYNEGTL